MCQQSRANRSAVSSAATTSASSGFGVGGVHDSQQGVHTDQESPQLSPRPCELQRPNAPTPEQTNHWLQDLDHRSPSPEVFGVQQDGDGAIQNVRDLIHPSRWQAGAGAAGALSTGQCPVSLGRASPDDSSSGDPDNMLRPRSPTPTKMLAWGEDEEDDFQEGVDGQKGDLKYGASPSDSEDHGRGDNTDGFIARLIEACQNDDVQRALGFYERLRRMGVPLYEGVYKLIIECCIRTHQLGHGMQFYDTLRSSGQRVSSRLVTVLMEACARDQHSDKVHALWQDWCPAGEALSTSNQGEVLLVTVSALIRTMSPDLALEVLKDAMQRSGERLASCLGDVEVEVEVEELLQLVDSAAGEAHLNGAGQLGGDLLASLRELEAILLDLLNTAASSAAESTASTFRAGAGGSSLSRPSSAAADTATADAATARPFSRRGWDAEDEMLLMEDVDLDLDLAAM